MSVVNIGNVCLLLLRRSHIRDVGESLSVCHVEGQSARETLWKYT